MNINRANDKSLMPSIAVLLAAYNGVKWIEEQINSILAQQGTNLKIFISVDPSTDGTLMLCRNLAARHSCISILPFNERFGGAARNFFKLLGNVDFSDFDYICLADQDDIWLPDKLARAHEVLSRTGADAYSSNVIAFWPDGRKIMIEKSQNQVKWDFLFEAAGPGCTYVMRKELGCAIQQRLMSRWADVQEVGLHDWFIYAFARANGYVWVIDDHAGMLYRQHEKNQVGVNFGWKAFVHRARNIFAGWGFAQSSLIAELIGLEDDHFVRHCLSGGRAGLLRLAFHAWDCRRRLRDKILFFLSCFVLSVAGNLRK